MSPFVDFVRHPEPSVLLFAVTQVKVADGRKNLQWTRESIGLYNPEPLDSVLLVSPNKELSEQHLRELEASGIPARCFDLSASGLWSGDRDTVQVVEITKLVEEKGGGVSVPVEAFEGLNHIFVDEGHKGSGGEAWRKYRGALGETGFTFEYRATSKLAPLEYPA